MKKLLWILLVVIIIAVGILGYGFWGGIRTKKMADESEKIFTASQNIWKPEQILDQEKANLKTDKPASLKNFYQKILDDCSTALTKISQANQTRKSNGLKADLERYYNLGRKGSENALVIVDYLINIQEVSHEMESVTKISATTPGQYVTELNKLKTAVDNDIKTLKKAKTVPSVEEFNQELILLMTDFSDLLGQAIGYFQNNQASQAAALEPQFQTLMERSNKLGSPKDEEVQQDILTEAEQQEMSNLANKIPKQISELKKVIFSY